jgi:1-deoxy-D-xylulose-5-phosphate synthase
MSIGKNVGGMSKHLALLRLKPGYFGLKKAYRKFTLSFPGGKWLYRVTHRIKEFLKRGLIGTSMFEEMGLTYLGPVDGHDIGKVSYLLQVAKELQRPVLVHVITQKGRGYTPAEKEPQHYHGVGQFDPKEGVCPKLGQETFSAVFGDELVSLASSDSKICAITAAMEQGTGLECFAQKFPHRFYDVGIAEGHAISLAAGLAAGGLTPVVALYSTFLQRGYDMLIHDIALMGNHVVLAVDRCGLVGEDGATHHGVFDVGYLSQIPNLSIYAPATEKELRKALYLATQVHTGPVAIRYPRGYCGQSEQFPTQLLGVTNAQVTFVTYGSISAQVYKAIQQLETEGIQAELVRLTQLKPLDCADILESAGRTGLVIVVEEVVSAGCIGAVLAEQIAAAKANCKVHLINLGDSFTPHGSIEELYRYSGLDALSIVKKTQEVLMNEK